MPIYYGNNQLDLSEFGDVSYGTNIVHKKYFTISYAQDANGYIENFTYNVAGSTTTKTSGTITISYGSIITVNGNDLTVVDDKTHTPFTITANLKADTAQYEYHFGGWGNGLHQHIVTGDITITPTATRTLKYYTVSFSADEDSALNSNYSPISVPYGTEYTISSDYKTLTINGTSYTGHAVTQIPNANTYASRIGWGIPDWTSSISPSTSGTITSNKTFYFKTMYKEKILEIAATTSRPNGCNIANAESTLSWVNGTAVVYNIRFTGAVISNYENTSSKFKFTVTGINDINEQQVSLTYEINCPSNMGNSAFDFKPDVSDVTLKNGNLYEIFTNLDDYHYKNSLLMTAGDVAKWNALDYYDRTSTISETWGEYEFALPSNYDNTKEAMFVVKIGIRTVHLYTSNLGTSNAVTVSDGVCCLMGIGYGTNGTFTIGARTTASLSSYKKITVTEIYQPN